MKNNMLAIAYSLAAEAFKDKLDKQGRPYFEHCLQVMLNLNTEDDDELKQIALLHDYLEYVYPGKINEGSYKLLELGFSSRVVYGILRMTKLEEETYEEYISSLKKNKDAIKVKLEDLEHNSCITRLKSLTQKDVERTIKYHKTYVELKEYIKEIEGDW